MAGLLAVDLLQPYSAGGIDDNDFIYRCDNEEAKVHSLWNDESITNNGRVIVLKSYFSTQCNFYDSSFIFSLQYVKSLDRSLANMTLLSLANIGI